jgi:hypothetical protein
MRLRQGSPREVLAGIAAIPAPEPRPSFVRDLEARLGALIEASAAGDVIPEIELSPPSGPARRSSRALTAASAAVCVLALAIGVSTAGIGVDPSREVATGVGSRQPTTTDGAARRAGAPIDVTAGLEDASGAASSPRSVAPRARPSSRSSTSAAPGGAAVATDSSTSVTSASSTQPVAAPAAPARPPTAAEQPADMELTASGTPARVFLSWDRYEGADFAAYLVLRANGPDSPDHPDASGRTLMLLRIENAEMTSHQDTPKVGTEPRYRVVVVRKDGTVAAKSPAVIPTTPLSSTSSSVDLREL